MHTALRKQHIKVLQMHYVAPQVWAWKKRRAKTMYKYIDRLLTLFPNEPAYFTPHHLATDFVGHPVIESPLVNADAKHFLEKYNIGADKKIMLILPGSRHNEVAHLLPLFMDVAKQLKQKHPELYFVLPTVKTVEKRVRTMIAENNADILVLTDQAERHSATVSAVAAIAASGTVALELAIVNIPHLIAYKVPAITAWLVRRLTKIKYVNLTNLLLDELIIPELLQEDCTKENLLNVAEDLLNPNSDLCQREQQGFVKLRQVLGVGVQKPSERAAEIILQSIEGYKQQ